MLNFLQHLGAWTLKLFEITGRVTLFAGSAFRGMVSPHFSLSNFLHQLMHVGFFSLPVVGVTAIFTGAVLALQSYSGFSRFSAESAIATVVVLSITRELGPVLAGLMVAGRTGASMAAELGTMRVTEQIDALVTLSAPPVPYLISPRILAGVISLPLLVIIADIVGIYGGYLVSTHLLGFNAAAYLKNTFNYLETIDVVSGLIKAGVFGYIITLMGCDHGYHSKGGAQGVGQATTMAVVSASMLILLSNYFITDIFFTPSNKGG
jgi:phospholipid/cholesterol/gamma-HCH transport system permease protein